MKKVIFIVFVLFSNLTFTQNYYHRNSSANIIQNVDILEQNHIPYLEKSLLTLNSYDSVRALSEINTVNNNDMIPWLSPDGLRLYFIRGFYTQQLWFTHRSSIYSYFEEPTLMTIAYNGALSCWLSNDEYKIYYCAGAKKVYYSYRNVLGAPFFMPDSIHLSGISLSLIGGISLTPAQDELYITSAESFPYKVQEFKRTSPTSFAYDRTLQMPLGYNPNGYGQLSKDGLTYFIGAAYNGAKDKIFQYTRTNLADSFSISSFQLVQNINDSLYFNFCPSMSDSLKCVVFNRAATLQNGTEDLYIAYKGSINSVFHLNEPYSSIKISPNPFSSTTQITLPKTYHTIFLSVYDMQGKLVAQNQYADCDKIQLNRNKLTNGMYFLKLIMDDKEVTTGKIVVSD